MRYLLIVAVLLGAALILSVGCSRFPAHVPSEPITPEMALRRPVAMRFVDDGKLLVVACQRSGSVSVVDVQAGHVLSEITVGKELADLAVKPDSTWVFAADSAANKVIVLRRDGADLHITGSVDVDMAPASLLVSPDGTKLFVASLWARRLDIIDISSATHPQVTDKLDLDFSPRKMFALPDSQHLVIADAFGGNLAVVDMRQPCVVGKREFHAHNIRSFAMSLDGKRLLLPHQALMSEFPTTQNGVHWGAVMMNVIRSEPIDVLMQDEPGPPRAASLTYLGTMDNATGDPHDLLMTRDGRQIVSYAGTSEVAFHGSDGAPLKRLSVGKRPTALALSPDEKTVFVANTFSDSISVINVADMEVTDEISLGPQPELSSVDRGEMLFHNSRLSSDGWFSCQSCHVDGHTNGQLNDNFGDHTTGAPKRVLSLLGVADTQPWAWDGGMVSLEEQVHKSIETTMRGPPIDEEQARAIADYIRSLEPPPSLAQARGEIESMMIARGREVFESRGCAECHPAPNYTNEDVYDVGLADENGARLFNPPSLVGVSQRNRFFHDNRATGLLAVFTEHAHGQDQPLAEGEIERLVCFLESL